MFAKSCNRTSIKGTNFVEILTSPFASKIQWGSTVVVLLFGMWSLVACSSEEPSIDVNEPSKSAVPSETAIERYSPPQRSVNASVVSAYASSYSEGISVTGASSISTEPDLVLLNLGVEAFASSVGKARSRAAKSMDSLVGTLRKKGVKELDIKTTRFSIHPRYEYQESIVNGRPIGKQVLSGYVVNNDISAKIRDLDKVGEIIDSAVDSGGDDTRINSIIFTLNDTNVYMNTLREQAVEDAFSKAKHYADLANVTLGPMLSLSEIGPVSIRSQGAMDFGMRSMAMAESSSISSGQLNVDLTVNIVFSVNY